MKYTNALIILCTALLSQSALSMERPSYSTNKIAASRFKSILQKYNITDPREKKMLHEIFEGSTSQVPSSGNVSSYYFYDAVRDTAKLIGNENLVISADEEAQMHRNLAHDLEKRMGLPHVTIPSSRFPQRK